jgi:septal ring factor EnvC (AmiA/AmiB activator)
VQELRHQLELTERSLRESQLASDTKDRQIASQSEIIRSFERQLAEVNRQVDGLKRQIG